MSRLDHKRMAESTKAERKESLARITVALAAYGAQRDRLLKQAEDAKALADILNLAYTVALAAYLPTPEAAAGLQAFAEAYNEAVRAVDKSSVAAAGFGKLIERARENFAAIETVEPTLPLVMREDRVFNVMKVTVYTNGELNYGIHETMLKADTAYAKAVALAAGGQSA